MLAIWADKLRADLLQELGPGRIGSLATSAGVAVAAWTGLTMAATPPRAKEESP
ncbi:MAG: hypothetical protein ACRDVL_04675 [Acidimicrobiia bacterium]